jgi:hypothetical protein
LQLLLLGDEFIKQAAAGAHAELVEIGLEGEDAMATKRTTKSYDDTIVP